MATDLWISKSFWRNLLLTSIVFGFNFGEGKEIHLGVSGWLCSQNSSVRYWDGLEGECQ